MEKMKFQRAIICISTLQTFILSAVLFYSINPDIKESASSQTILSNDDSYISQKADINQIKNIIRSTLEQEIQNTFLNIPTSDEKNSTAYNRQTAYLQETLTTESQSDQREYSNNESYSIVTQAISDGVWTQENTHSISAHLPNLSNSQRIELLEYFHGAVNRQELELEDIPIL